MLNRFCLIIALSVICCSCVAERRNTEISSTAESSGASTRNKVTEKVSESVCHSVHLSKPSTRRIKNWVFQSADFKLATTNEWVGDCVLENAHPIDYRYMALIQLDPTTDNQHIVELEIGVGDTSFVEWQTKYDLPQGLLPLSNDKPITDETFKWGE